MPSDYYIFQPLSFLVDGEQQRDQQLTGQCAENKALWSHYLQVGHLYYTISLQGSGIIMEEEEDCKSHGYYSGKYLWDMKTQLDTPAQNPWGLHVQDLYEIKLDKLPARTDLWSPNPNWKTTENWQLLEKGELLSGTQALKSYPCSSRWFHNHALNSSNK